MLKINREDDIPPLPPCISTTLLHALTTEQSLPPPDRGEVYLLEPSDSDDTFFTTFGSPLSRLPLERVIHHPDHFLCYLVRNNNRCDTLVIPDNDLLNLEWRTFLVSQL